MRIARTIVIMIACLMGVQFGRGGGIGRRGEDTAVTDMDTWIGTGIEIGADEVEEAGGGMAGTRTTTIHRMTRMAEADDEETGLTSGRAIGPVDAHTRRPFPLPTARAAPLVPRPHATPGTSPLTLTLTPHSQNPSISAIQYSPLFQL